MDAKPLKKELYERLAALGADIVTLEFSGGSDQGYLYVGVEGDNIAQYMAINGHHKFTGTFPPDEIRKEIHRLQSDIEEWAWTVYEYSGAGEGISYGDTITYDLKNQTMSSKEWYHAVKEGEEYHDTLETQ